MHHMHPPECPLPPISPPIPLSTSPSNPTRQWGGEGREGRGEGEIQLGQVVMYSIDDMQVAVQAVIVVLTSFGSTGIEREQEGDGEGLWRRETPLHS
jgi:hypothetical protein